MQKNEMSSTRTRFITIVIIALVCLGALAYVAAVFYDSSQQPVGVTLLPEDDVLAIIAENPAGTTFVFEPGVYRGLSIEPRDGDQFIGNVGVLFPRGDVILNGATLLEDFEQEGDVWVTTGIGRDGAANNDICLDENPRCNDRYDLFFNDEPLLHVASPDDLVAGSYHYDYDADLIYLADDPEGHQVELATAGGAFFSDAADVYIANIIMEKYATPAQHGVVHAPDSDGWTIENSVMRLNHGGGVRIGDNMTLRNNRIINNGQIGVSGIGDGVLVENNEIAYNNYAGYRWSWEAGGTKFVRTTDLIVRGNRVHNNRGPGLWTDIDNIGTLYEENTVVYNDGAGIFHEISYDAIIRDNVVKFNGLAFDTWLWGSQILVSSSSNVDIENNEVVIHPEGGNGIGIVQQDRGEGAEGVYRSYNNSVTDNTVIYLGTSGMTGAAADHEFEAFFSEGNNTFDDNTYYVEVENGRYWEWSGDPRDWASLQGEGQERDGTLNVGAPRNADSVPAGVAARNDI